MTTAALTPARHLAVVLLAVAVAALCWPETVAHQRLRRLLAQESAAPTRAVRPALIAARHTIRRLALTPRTNVGVAAVAGLALFLAAGPGAGIATALLTATVLRRYRRRTADHTQTAATRDVADALGALIAELRAGAHAAAAAESAAADAEPPAARALRTAAATARLGGAVAPALADRAATDLALAMPLARLARAWALADRYGVALADLLADVRRDLDHRARFAGRVRAAMSGPQATASVLAVLPLLGVLLGEAIGAAPLHVLTGTPAGQALLVVGVTLLCAGLRWSDWLIDRAIRHQPTPGGHP